MRLGLVSGFTLGIALVLSISLGLVSYLSYAKFRHAFIDLEASQYKAIGAELVAVFENSLNLGLGLNEIDNLQRMLDLERSPERPIVAIEVWAGASALLASSSDDSLGGVTMPTPVSAETDRNGAWHSKEVDHFFVGLPIINSFDETAGMLVLRYRTESFDRAMAEVRQMLFRSYGTAWLTCLVVLIPLIWLVFRPMTRGLRIMTNAIAGDTVAERFILAREADDEGESLVSAVASLLRSSGADGENHQNSGSVR
jgi:hypothetical protein